MTVDAHRQAMVASSREELKRIRVAVEALAVAFDQLLDPAAAALPPPGDDGLALVHAAAYRPAVALAMALVSYLQAGGKLEPDLAQDLSQELAAARARRRRDPGPPPPRG